MKAKKKTRPRTRTQATYTATVRKIAHHILLLASQRPQGELLELTQSQIADALEVSERSVIRAMPLLRSGIEHAGRGFWRIVSAPALKAIALDPQKTPAHNDDTPAHPLTPAPTQSAIPCPTPHLEDIVCTLAEQVRDLTATVDALRLQTARLREEVAVLKKRRPRYIPPAAKRLSKWIKARCLPFDQIAAMFNIPANRLKNYVAGTLKPSKQAREHIRARTNISTKAWDAPLPPHIQKTLGRGFQ